MAEQFGSKVAGAAERTAEDAGNLYEKTKERAEHALDAGREGFEQVAEQGRRQVESLSATIREWPLLSVGVAFVAGCMVSRLFRR
jgi:ElaB/YqjD/DUF883 family membrane-anchored ribosome-binding protein